MTQITRYIIQNRDDVLTYSNDHSAYFPNGFFGVGSAPPDTRESLIIFRNISIPRRSRINSAVIHFIAQVTQTSTVVRSTLYGINQSNPFTAFPGDIYTRPLTNASVNFDISSTWTAGGDYSSPDVSAIVQEIVNRDDWGSGHGLGFMWKDRGSDADARRSPSQMDYGDGTQAAYIVIDFTPANLPITTMRVSLPLRNALTDTDPSHFSLIADTDNVLIKEAVRGSVSISAGGNQAVTHNLGYYPDVFVYVKLSGSDESRILHSDVTKEVGYPSPTYYRHESVNSFRVYSRESVSLVGKYFIFYNPAEI